MNITLITSDQIRHNYLVKSPIISHSSVPTFLQLIAENCPDWDYDPGAYEFTSWIAGSIVLYDGEHISDEGDILAAFDSDGLVRGIAIEVVPDFGPYNGMTLFV